MKSWRLPSIQARLMAAFCGLSLLFALAAGAWSFYDTYQETHEFQDGLLRQTAAYLHPNMPLPDDGDIEHDAQIHVDYPAAPHPEKIPTDGLGEGFYSISYDDERYRVYIRDTVFGRITVWQDNEYREELAARAAWGGVAPLLLLMPLMCVLIVLIVRRTLCPVRKLARDLAQRRDDDLTPLQAANIPSEINGFVEAINQMFARTGQLMQQQQRFIADAAHELRTPMTALSVQAERIDTAQLPAEQQQRVGELQQGIRRNRYLLEQLLSHARAQAPEAQRPKTRLGAQALFRQIIQDIYPLAEAKEQDLGVADAADPQFDMNETDAYTLIKTLVDNAVRHTPKGSRIDLSAAETATQLVFCVEDNGTGIAASERTRVLDPFYRVLGGEAEGTGLGLAIADTIAKRYGGRIELGDSRRFASGLLVRVYLDKRLLQN